MYTRHLIFTKKTRPALPRLFIFNYEESSKHFVTKERKEKMKKDDTDLLKYFRYINNCIDDKRTGMMLDGKSVICRYIYIFFLNILHRVKLIHRFFEIVAVG